MTKRLSSYPMLPKRQAVQQKMINRVTVKGTGFENLSMLHSLLRTGLKVFKLEERGLQNILDFKIIKRDLQLPNLDTYWQGKKILHLSDTHLDGIPGLVELVVKQIQKIDYDLCFITGDFRFGKGKFHPASMAPTIEMLKAVKAPLGCYGVLGNHDFIEQVSYLEENGMQVLLNEGVNLGNNLWLAGVDDPHLYKCDDIAAAAKNIPDNSQKILLVHSPEKVIEAESAGFHAYLCGHTHGGQISLPLIGRPFSNARCKRKFAFGGFQYGEMHGYTHNGTGASSVAARFRCPSEIVIHTLTSR